MSNTTVLNAIRGKLIVSCQANAGDPLDDLDVLRRIAASVLLGGAGALRAEGSERIEAFRSITLLPIIGMVKTYDCNSDVYITATFDMARRVSAAGAEIIALDCTRRRLTEAEPWPGIIEKIHRELGLAAWADIATLEDALAAQEAGADIVATTLHGYTADTPGARTVDWSLIEDLVSRMTIPVVLEGHVRAPEEVTRAFRIGVHAVVVGSAITRPQTITERYVRAIQIDS